MVKFFKFLQDCLKKLIDVTYMVQIIVTVVIIAFAFYWFFDLINHQFLAFLTPVADNIKEFMHVRFDETMNKGANGMDGSLFLFVVFLGVFVFAMAQAKVYVDMAIKKVGRLINKIKLKNEDEFNAQLRTEADQAILAYRNVVLIVKLSARRKIVDDVKPEEQVEAEKKEMEDKLICDFYSRIKESPCCKFAKNGDQLIVTLKGFTHVDKLLYYATKALEDIRYEARRDGWIVRFYSAIDAYDDKALIKDVYYDLQILLKLYLHNEIVCYGNFCNRYYMESNNLFEAYLKGIYELTEPENVWSLVKKY